MKTIEVTGRETIHLGSVGENSVTCVTFDITKWIEELGEGGTLTLLNRRPDEDEAYPVNATLTDGIVSWIVSDTDTEIVGNGKCQLIYEIEDDDIVEKSPLYNTRISASLSLVGETTVLVDDDEVALAIG